MKSEKERKWKEVIDILRDYSGFEDLLEEERSRTINDIADWLNGLAKGEIYDGTDKKLVNALDNLLRSTNQKIVSKIKDKIDDLQYPKIRCLYCGFEAKEKDWDYDADACEMTCPKCNKEATYPDYRKEIKILQQLLKEVDE